MKTIHLNTIYLITLLHFINCSSSLNKTAETKNNTAIRSNRVDIRTEERQIPVRTGEEPTNYIKVNLDLPKKWRIEGGIISTSAELKIGEFSPGLSKSSASIEEHAEKTRKEVMIDSSNPQSEAYRTLESFKYHTLPSGKKVAQIRSLGTASDGRRAMKLYMSTYILKLNSYVLEFYFFERKKDEINFADVSIILQSFERNSDL